MRFFQTNISKVYVDIDGVVYIDFFEENFNLENLTVHYQILDQELGEGKRMSVYSFKEIMKISIEKKAKDFNNRMLEARTESFAMASTNGMIRIFVNVYLKLAKLNFPMKIMRNKEDARKWVLKQRSERRVRELKKALL